jgi:diguanylate cyclase (GGDEF)-like protein
MPRVPEGVPPDGLQVFRAVCMPLRPAGLRDALTAPGSGPWQSGSAPERRLAAWIGIQTVTAVTALLLVAASNTPILPPIALHLPGLRSEGATTTGLVFWLVFGLLGGVRSSSLPGGGTMTFSMPFIVAGAVLGGPLVGGLMGLVSEFEVRELRTQPWYGTLANHSVAVIAAIAAGVGALVVRGPLEAALPGQEGLTFFLTAMVAALLYDAVNLGLVIPTLALRNGLTAGEASRIPDASFRATVIAEAILAWNLAVAYTLIGWWAPVVIIALVLVVWQAHDRGDALRHDPMTRLLNDLGLRPRLDAALEAARRGRRISALLEIDLDRFKAINDTYLHAAGDEVIVATAGRLLAAVRATDVVARRHTAGDEFAVLLDDVKDMAAARKVAERIQLKISEPIHLRTRNAAVSVGCSIGLVLLDGKTEVTAWSVLTLANARMAAAKGLGSGIVSEGEDDDAAQEQRNAQGPRRPEPPPSAGPPAPEPKPKPSQGSA